MIRRLRRPVTAVAAVLLLGGAAATVAPAGGAGAGAAAPAPGTIIDAQAVPAPAGAVAWRVRYHSRDVVGNDIATSGLVIAPEGPAPEGGRAVVAWAHATTGLADVCTPSLGRDAAAAILWVDDLLDAGYVVAATDYAGLGTDGVHPYLVGESEGRAVLDSIRAARNLPTGAGRTAAVYGHSQGGHSALFAGEIAAGYAPELAVRGIAAGAPVADPARFLDDTIARYDTVGFLVLTALGFQAAYPDLAQLPVLAGVSAELADVAVNGCANEVVDRFRGVGPDAVLGSGPAAAAVWTSRFRANAAGRARSIPPVLYWQGGADDLTRLTWADAYRRRACRRGTAVDFRVYPDADHVTVIDAAHDDVFAFFAEVLDGSRSSNTCARSS